MQRDGMTDTIRTDADLKTDAGLKAGAKPNADAKPNAGAKPNADAKPNAGVKPNASAKKGGFPAIDASTPSYFEDITNFEEAGAESAGAETSGAGAAGAESAGSYIYEFGFENIPQLRKLLLERGCFTEEECTRIAVEVFRSKDQEFVRCSSGRGRQNRSAGQAGREDGIRSGQRSEDPRDPDGQDDRRPVDFIYQL